MSVNQMELLVILLEDYMILQRDKDTIIKLKNLSIIVM